MKRLFLLFFILNFFCNNSSAQIGKSILFRDFIEIADYLDEDDKKILREDQELMNSKVYFSIDEAKKAVTANVLAISLVYEQENQMKYLSQKSDLVYFPNLKFFMSPNSYFPLNNNKKIKYVFQKGYIRYQTNFIEPVFYENISTAIIAKLEDKALKDCPTMKLGNLKKISLKGKIRIESLFGLSNLPKLEILDLSDNNFGRSPIIRSIPPQVRKLNLSGNNIGKAEVVTLNFPTLQSLDVSNNGISEILFTGLPELTELDLSDNLFQSFPGEILKGIPKLKTLNISNNPNIGNFNDYKILGFLDSLDVSGTKINNYNADLLNLRFAIPNTILVFNYRNSGKKVTSGRIDPAKYEELKALKAGWESGEFNSSIKFGKYFLDQGDIAMGDFIFATLVYNFPEKNFETTFAIATYLDKFMLTGLSAPLYRTIIESNPGLDFKRCFSLAKAMQGNHVGIARDFLPRIMNHDSLNYFLKNRLARIEYTSLLYNCGLKNESDQQFEIILAEIDLANDKEVYELAKYYEESSCHILAIRVYEKMIESPLIESEEKKLFASLSIADIYHDKKDISAGFSFVHYEGVCYKDYSNDRSKEIILQGCNKAYDAYQDQISLFLAEHKKHLSQMKKKVQQAATARNIGTTVSALGNFASMIPGAGNIAPAIGMTSTITNQVTDAIATGQMASYDLLSSDAFSIEDKISFLESKKEMVGARINELQVGNTEVANVAKVVPVAGKPKTKSAVPVKSNLSSVNAADLIFLSLSSYNVLNGDYSKTFEHLNKAFKSDQIPIEQKLELFFQYYSYEQNSHKSITNSIVLAEALLTAHPANPQIVSIYSSIQIVNKKFEAAINQLEKVRLSDPNNYQIIGKLLFAYDKTEEWTKLNEVSQEAVGNFDNIFLPHYYLGISLFHLEKHNEAIDALEKCLALIKQDTEVKPDAMAILGRCYSEKGSFEKAESCFLQAMSLAPDDIQIKMHYCYGLLAQPDRINDAENLAKELIASENNNFEICDLYAFTLFNNGKYDEAKTWALKSIDNHNCTKGLPYEHYGDILYKSGNTSQAVVYWNLAKSKGKNVSVNLDKKIETKAYVK